MASPTFEQVQAWAAAGYTQCAVYRELVADLETPVSAYLKVAQGHYSFLLESVEGGEQIGRYSFIGCEPHLIIRGLGQQSIIETANGERTSYDDLTTLDQLERLVVGSQKANPAPQPDLPRFTGGAVGFLGYETVRTFERLPAPTLRPLQIPDGVWMVVKTVLAFDHVRHTIKIMSTLVFDPAHDLATQFAEANKAIEAMTKKLVRPLAPEVYSSSAASPSLPELNEELQSNQSFGEFSAAIEKAREYIRAGDIFQVVLSQRFQRETDAEPFAVYRALRTVNPSPYMFFLNVPDAAIIGASPEMLVRVEDGIIETHPIAGTRRRGRDADDEARMQAELLADEKERAEHLMLVDLGRNDVGRVSLPGSVHVPKFMQIEKYSHVMHLVSVVKGTLDTARYSPLHALRACFPAGTLTGAPKVRAMEIIAELEPSQRGPYGGCVGYVSFGGLSLDTAITIRTMVIKDGVAYMQAGAGIVADSDVKLEDLETRNKAGSLIRALHVAEMLEL
ncbi:anthranilate synthase component I [Herpetosiphon giganteus]|uniref:anthranilate synthase component I n=1 Tax=Herpetosiphon giganteus TaxID=2029754 RepID=UPI00195A5D7A|nr:anthranilate synthase component I [Herpetosiphon giganteus]MBM7842964.1 anthranilate synthase component 1 [Herpetosiphon giganteus]